MATDRSRRRAVTLLAGVSLLIALLYVTGGVVSGLRSAANLVVAPFSWTINTIAKPVGRMFSGTVNYSDVVAQNQKLRYELGRAQMRANENWALVRQLQELTTQAHLAFVASLPTVMAQVTTLSPTNFAATVDISTGRDDGVLVGMPVVANGGLVGRVIATTPHGATVRLITDVNSSVGVTYGSNQTSLVISGRGVNNGLAASAVPLTTRLNPGTVLYTDGLRGALYPYGLPVATVRQVTLTPGAATFNLALQPTADLRHMMYLDVVLWEPST